jgi:hypothetical protein
MEMDRTVETPQQPTDESLDLSARIDLYVGALVYVLTLIAVVMSF